MHRRSRARQVVDLVDLDVERQRDVVADEFEPGMVDQVLDVVLAAGEEVVGADDMMAAFDQAVAQVAAEETGATRDKDLAAPVVLAHVVCFPLS